MKRLAPLVLAVAALLVYANTFRGPFVFDIAAVTQNPSIEHFATALSPPEALSVTGRPPANLSLAPNYAISGRDPWSYHALNLALHVTNALRACSVAAASRPRIKKLIGGTPMPLFSCSSGPATRCKPAPSPT